MLEMLMLLGTGLAAAGLAGMSGIGSQATLEAAKPAGAARKGYHLGDDYKGGEGEALLSQVRRLGGALDVAKLVPGLAGKVPQAAPEGAGAPLAASHAAAVEAEAMPAEDEQVDFDGLLALLKNEPAAAPAEPVATAEAADIAVEDIAGEDSAAEDMAAQPETLSWQDDQIPVIADFAAGSEELLLMLPEGMAPDTRVLIAASGPEGADAAVVLEDAEGRMTAVIVAGAYGRLEAGDVVLETAG